LKPRHLFTLLLALLVFSPPTWARQAWLEHAQALEKRGDWQGLLTLGGQWTQTEANNALAWFVLGRAWSALKRYPEAIGAYQRNLHLDPNDMYAYNNLGNAYLATQRYREAMDAYQGAVRSSPDYVLAWENLGLTFYQLKGPSGVARALKKLGESDPGLAGAWRRLAIDYTLSRDPRATQGAIQLLRNLSNAERERMFEILLEQS
jgi:tetratricopeptide (TPR) repeat protein